MPLKTTYVRITSCPEKNVWYSEHIGEVFRVTEAKSKKFGRTPVRLYRVLDIPTHNKRTIDIYGRHGVLYIDKRECVEDFFTGAMKMAIQTKLRKQKRRKKLNFSVPLDEKTIVELEELIAKEYKTITKTEWCRYAIEFCMRNGKFIRELKAVD